MTPMRTPFSTAILALLALASFYASDPTLLRAGDSAQPAATTPDKPEQPLPAQPAVTAPDKPSQPPPAPPPAAAEPTAPAKQETPAKQESPSKQETPAQEATDEASKTAPGTAYEELAVLTEALMLVRRHYVEELPYRDILYGALDGMLGSLDPHSHFMPPVEFDEFQEETEGTFCGVGIELGVRDGILTVVAPIDGSPAYRAGVIAGDRILKVAGKEAYDLSIRDAADRIRGKAGETVVLTIGRNHREPFDVTLTREQIVVASIRGARILKPGIGYVRITKFDEQTMPAFRDKLDGLRRDGMKALLLDLRSNPGGLLSMAVQVAGTFLERGKRVVSVKGRSALDKPKEFKADGIKPLVGIPVVVLIDEGSASASEVVAGALQDHRRAVVIGQTSFGKASVQTVIPLRSNPDCGLRLTTAHYFTPNGRLIHGEGIHPDVEVAVTAEERMRSQLRRAYDEAPDMFPKETREDVATATDKVLDRAIDVLSALLAIGKTGDQ